MAGKWELRLGEFAKKVGLRADTVVRKVGLDLLGRVVMRTPVGNPALWKRPRKGYVGGRLRGNWQVGINSVPAGETGSIDKSGTDTIAKGSALIGTVKAGQTLTIVNNAPHALPVEFGHSKQAPAGMFRTSVSEFKTMVDKALKS